MNEPITLQLEVTGDDLDTSERAAAARNLREMLLTLNVDEVEYRQGPTPPSGAKAGEWVQAGALLVTVTPALVTAVVNIVVSWLERQLDWIEIELHGQRFKGRLSRRQREELVAALLRPPIDDQGTDDTGNRR